MRFEGYLVKSGKFWSVEIPLLHIHTQGRSRKDAYAMAKDAIESLLEEKEFKVRIHPGQADTFAIEASELSPFIAFMLKRQRSFRNLTVRDVAARMGSKSPNAYAQYEHGKVRPSFDKLVEILRAIDPEFQPVLKAS